MKVNITDVLRQAIKIDNFGHKLMWLGRIEDHPIKPYITYMTTELIDYCIKNNVPMKIQTGMMNTFLQQMIEKFESNVVSSR